MDPPDDLAPPMLSRAPARRRYLPLVAELVAASVLLALAVTFTVQRDWWLALVMAFAAAGFGRDVARRMRR
ncbi:hypothetical protein AB0M28_32005 [Streptomyces sp. NPDC051940]|uniref:hypothetical protein n=1 Tax=Streptomyces sp. NPDC051940 TaxID=3155675 RepID=UPI00343E6491